jgi:L-rhamnose isomerase/sugar isomerase
LKEAQKNCDVVEAEEILMDAFRTDVRSILREYRRQKGLPEDPLRVFREGDYMEKRRRERR